MTVSAEIDEKLERKMAELGIKPSEVIRKALEKEVRVPIYATTSLKALSKPLF